MEKKEFFIIRIPDTGSLHEAVRIIAERGISVTRCHYNRSIDAMTAFLSVAGPENECAAAGRALAEKGYLQTTIQYPKNVRFTIIVPETPGTLHNILTVLDSYHAEIITLLFDNRGKNPDRLNISIRVRESTLAQELITTLQEQYSVTLDGYDCGDDQGNSLFYLKYAEQVKEIIGDVDEPYLLDLLNQFTHLAQQLTEYGKEYEDALEQIILNGHHLARTRGEGFYADVQIISLQNNGKLYCFQLPGGGSIFVVESGGEKLLIDTGYGIYHQDVCRMFAHYGLTSSPEFSRIILTHADTDHCGASGYYHAPVYAHEGTVRIIEENNRAFGARSEDLVLEQVYTVMINLFARMNPARNIRTFSPAVQRKIDDFSVLDTFTLGDLSFDVLESHGGHQHGLIYLLCRDAGLLFTSDTILNLKYLTPERSAYNGFAVYLVTTVNVDPERVRSERKALTRLAHDLDNELKNQGKKLVICCGHGPVSVYEGENLVPLGQIESYRHNLS